MSLRRWTDDDSSRGFSDAAMLFIQPAENTCLEIAYVVEVDKGGTSSWVHEAGNASAPHFGYVFHQRASVCPQWARKSAFEMQATCLVIVALCPSSWLM